MNDLKLLSCIVNVLVFVLLGFPGYIMKKKKLLNNTHIDGLSLILVNVLWPAMVIDAMAHVKYNNELMHESIYTLVVSSLMYTVSVVIMYLICKYRKIKKEILAVIVFGVAFNNTGLIGMPFVNQILGSEALFFGSLIEMINDIFIFTIGIIIMNSNTNAKDIRNTYDGKKINVKKNNKIDIKSILSPGFISVFIGFAIFLFKIQLPNVISEPLGYLAKATAGIALLIVGASFADVDFCMCFKNKHVYFATFFRSLVVPVLMFLVLIIFGEANRLANQVIVIMSIMPAASVTIIFSRQYKKDVSVAIGFVMFSTIALIMLVPILLLIMSAVCKCT